MHTYKYKCMDLTFEGEIMEIKKEQGSKWTCFFSIIIINALKHWLDINCLIELLRKRLHFADQHGIENNLPSINVIYRPLDNLCKWNMILHEVFCLSPSHNSKLNSARTTKYSTATKCKISSKHCEQFLKHIQINFQCNYHSSINILQMN